MTANHPGEEDLAWLLSRATHEITQRLRAALEPEGLTLGQWWVLALLADGTGHTMSEAADHAMLPAPTLTKAVDQLVAANLVYRRADRHDRRRVLIYLTARGTRLHARLAGKLAGSLDGDVDTAEVAQLTQLLLRVLQRLR
jgi:MarR family transcriptional regulator, organic hydroperoxide resistance regulator